MKPSFWRLALGTAAAGLAIVVLALVARQPSLSTDELDQLGPGYEVLGVSELECGNGQRFDCGRTFSVRHDGSRDDLRQALTEVGITDDYGAWLLAPRSSDPSRSDVVLSFASSDPGAGVLFAYLLLLLVFLGMAVWMSTVLVAALIRRVRPSHERPD